RAGADFHELAVSGFVEHGGLPRSVVAEFFRVRARLASPDARESLDLGAPAHYSFSKETKG
ncbi:MAG: hypothetical protein VW169_17265, partial [Rhodospirillaceae bacterium]